MNLNDTFAKNLAYLRKKKNITQFELAEKLNYSDKAISKWERGESIPDIYTLKQIADLFEISVDDLIGNEKPEKIKPKNKINALRVFICLACCSSVWFVAMCCFSFLGILIPSIKETWLSFIYAIFVTFFILFILFSAWKNSTWKFIALSGTCWSFILSVYLTFNTVLPTTPINLWYLFLTGIPLQILLIFIYVYKVIRKK